MRRRRCASVCACVCARTIGKNTLTKSHRNVASSDRASERVVKPIPVCHGFPWQRRVCLSVSMSHTNYIKNLLLPTHTYTLAHTRTHARTQPGQTRTLLSNAWKRKNPNFWWLWLYILFCYSLHTLFFQEEKRKSHFYITIINRIKNQQTKKVNITHTFKGRGLPLPLILYILKQKKSALHK